MLLGINSTKNTDSMAKKIQSNIPPERYEEPRTAQERVEKFMLKAAEVYPLTKDFEKRMALTIKEYFEKNHEVIRLTTFTRAFGIPKRTFYDWINKYPLIEQAIEEAKEIIEERRLLHYARKDSPYHQNAMLKDLRAYSSQWYEIEKQEAALRALAKTEVDIAKGNTPVTIVDLANVPKDQDVTGSN